MNPLQLVSPATSLVNLRDVGSVSDHLVHGMLLRSDAPLAADDHSGYSVTWPPRTVIDLRDHGEQGDSPHSLMSTAEVITLPLMSGTAYNTEALPPSLVEIYRWILEESPHLLVRLVEIVATRPAPVLVHCAAGKDRTGVSIALVLSLLGINETNILADYRLTAENMPGVVARMIANHREGAHMIAEGDDPRALRMRELHGAPDEAMQSVLDHLRSSGGAEAWYLRHGGDAKTLAALRNRLLVADSTPPAV